MPIPWAKFVRHCLVLCSSFGDLAVVWGKDVPQCLSNPYRHRVVPRGNVTVLFNSKRHHTTGPTNEISRPIRAMKFEVMMNCGLLLFT